MTSFKYMGEFKDEKNLPVRVQEGAVMFKEPDAKKIAIIANVISILLLIVLMILTFFMQDVNIILGDRQLHFCFQFRMNFCMQYG